MNILITGGYGFIGSFVAERFYKENHSIFIIDNLSVGRKEHISFHHKALIADIKDERCEAFFKTHSIDVVIHCAAQTHVNKSIKDPVEDSSTNILGLINMLNLSYKYKVKKFVFCSSAAIYGNSQKLPLQEGEAGNPISPYGLNKWTGELYCHKWEEMYGVSSLIYRFSNVYGPRQHVSEESSVITCFTNLLLEDKPVTIHGDGEQSRDFIYVGDVAEAIYRGVMSQLSGVYNLSTGTEVTINQLVEALNKHHTMSTIQHVDSRQGDIRRSILDNTKIKRDLDWVPKYRLDEGLKKVFHYYEEVESTPTIVKSQKERKAKKIPFLPFLENIVLFSIFFGISFLLTPFVDVVDIWLIYILLAAILFEKTQIVVSAFLAIGVQAYFMASQGRIWTSLFVDNTLLATFTIYLLVGLIVSYKIERGRIELQFTKDELSSSQSKYSFLTSIYEDTLQVKEEMKEQILRMEDGIGKIYDSVKELDDLEPEALFNGAIHVLERTLKARHFAIYLVHSSGYMRLAVKSSDSLFQPSASIKREQGSLMDKAISDKKIYYNTNLSESEPVFVAPIIQHHEVIAVIVCHDVPFNRLTLSYKNMVDVVTRLISTSLARAYEYVNEINSERFIEGTNVLRPHYFKRILENKRKVFQELNIPTVKLEVLTFDHSIENLQAIGSLLRMNDHLGLDDKGILFILLSNATIEEAKFVMRRLQKKGILVTLDEKEEILHVAR
ncbi:NAD-dependent epimerase/dehydratase family protein [Metabacillus halosaccharovorans]|uniref:NAD-dependent epimerase/dehydratase family protein n=1 Tax=Metabacillus halosaccharovorans TaxID=930124 RepID=UPI001C1F473F|nr:NAD-dependent epimerase/dehydratase family protein [Metabacillus halosaccharovorans]MBU7594433.1 NAD-dependent epimerase/dehydratase family protein [Metabacillus halosaccharovorans]